MKKFFLAFVLSICCSLAYAQQWIEVVYLKNGGQIRGVVIEQVPGESLKIQTSDGSIFVFQMSEVEKITKEQIQRPQYDNGYNRNWNHEGNNSSYSSPLPSKEPYAGRTKEGRFSLDFGAGIAPNNREELINGFYSSVEKVVPSEYQSSFSFAKSIGFTGHAGVLYDKYFKKGSPWFWEGGAFAEFERIGFKGFFEGSKFVVISCDTWNLAALLGVGIQSSPNTEGLHLYGKAIVSAGYVAIANAKVQGYGEAAGYSYDMDSVGYGDTKGEGGLYLRPGIEIGFGNDNFFRMGIRYSPLFGNNNAVWCHCITLSVAIPIV